MTDLLLAVAAATFVLLIGYSAYKAISAEGEEQRTAAYKVLKLLLAAVTGASVVTLVALRQAGVL
ncbi:hypothetical protein SK571_31145 [Lentzea sp. BCCO 10_0798]|uniref:Twin transmembrane helix small protein n=1 Tax=Lentzea kristufekii TaxID=3095430 RepID=A0ABU4U0J4_9PSEU|nr:hypothetical protein [Lentzea sp. BCCO 10_0798]MDX8053848.1 hypothetical protein [Lentzea sp. BCCO 10_0798]